MKDIPKLNPATCHTWSYVGGTWEPLADDPLAPFDAGEWEETLKAAGYSYVDYSLDESPSFTLRCAVDENGLTARWQFVVDFNVCATYCWTIFVGSLPDLFALAPALGALATRDGAAAYISETVREEQERWGRR